MTKRDKKFQETILRIQKEAMKNRKKNPLVQGIKTPDNGKVLIGYIGVDAGLCWLGDPCYVFHKDGKNEDDKTPKALGKTWSEFVDSLYQDGDSVNAHQFMYDLGHEGLGVCVATGYGDGTYPVYATIKDGRMKKVEVKFF